MSGEQEVLSQEEADIHNLNAMSNDLGDIYNRIQDRLDELILEDPSDNNNHLIVRFTSADQYLDIAILSIGKAAAMLQLAWEQIHPPELGPEE